MLQSKGQSQSEQPKEDAVALDIEKIKKELSTLIKDQHVDFSSTPRDKQGGLVRVEATVTRFTPVDDPKKVAKINKKVSVSATDETYEKAQLKALKLAQTLLGEK